MEGIHNDENLVVRHERLLTNMDGRLNTIENELVDKKQQNGVKDQEMKSLREMIEQTSRDVAFLKGVKEGQKENKSDKKDRKGLLVQYIFISFAAVNAFYIFAEKVLHWV